MDFYYGYDLRNMSQRMPVNNIEIIGPYNKIVDREPILGDYIITRVYVGYWMWNSYGKVIGFNKDEKNEIIDISTKHKIEVTQQLSQGYDVGVVTKVQNLLYNSEYKRRQAAPGVKISERNFGYDRRYPITNAFRDREN